MLSLICYIYSHCVCYNYVLTVVLLGMKSIPDKNERIEQNTNQLLTTGDNVHRLRSSSESLPTEPESKEQKTNLYTEGGTHGQIVLETIRKQTKT